MNPCRCDGSVRHTHQHCLLKWISERGCWTCELCCYRFQVVAINMKRPWQVRRRWSRDRAAATANCTLNLSDGCVFVLQWQAVTITLVEKVQIIAVFLGSLFLVASISWLLWSALSPQAIWQRRDVLFQICYGMYGFMDLVCIGEFPSGFHSRQMLLKVSLSLIIGRKIQVEPQKRHRNGKNGLQCLPVQAERPEMINKI